MTNARAPFRLPTGIAVAAIVICLAAIGWMVNYIVPFRLAGQVYLMIGILLAFRYWPPMAALVRSMPVAHRVIFGVLIGAMLLGHYTVRGRTYFPFVAWEIFPFVHEANPVMCREFIATTAAGHKVRLLVEQQFPSIVQIDPLDGFSPGRTEALALAVTRMYNAHHAADPVRGVDLMSIAVPLHPPAGESPPEPSCVLIKHYDISLGR